MKKYTLTIKISETGFDNRTETLSISDKQYQNLKGIFNLKDEKLKKKKPVLPYKLLKPDDEFFDDILNSKKELDLKKVKEILNDGDYCSWDDETGDKDNAKPFRLLIRDKYLIEWEVGRGECIEATWDCTIWEGVCLNLKLIETK